VTKVGTFPAERTFGERGAVARMYRRYMVKASVTMFAFIVVAAYLLPLLYMVTTSLKQPSQVSDPGAPAYPATPLTATYEGASYPLYSVPFPDGTTRQLMLIDAGRSQSILIMTPKRWRDGVTKSGLLRAEKIGEQNFNASCSPECEWVLLRAQPARSLGGVFAAQVVEHLPPAVLQAMLVEAHRALRPGGRLVLETVNTRSVIGFLEVYLRDLTHRTPLHPDTLSFLAAAQGFTEVRVEMRSPVDPAGQLQSVPTDGLPPRAAAVLNENAARLNALLYGPQEYVLIARR